MLSLRWYNIALAHLVQFTVRSLGAFGLTYSVPIITRSDYLNGAHPSVHFFSATSVQGVRSSAIIISVSGHCQAQILRF